MKNLNDGGAGDLSLYEQEYDEVITYIGAICRDKNGVE
jgi:hypothetical protein